MAGVRAFAKAFLSEGLECPACEGGELRQRHREGLLEEKVLSRVNIWPFSCRDCRRRFYRIGEQPKAPKKSVPRRKRAESSGHIPRPSRKEFEVLISEIAEAEQALFGESKSGPSPQRAGTAGVINYSASRRK